MNKVSLPSLIKRVYKAAGDKNFIQQQLYQGTSIKINSIVYGEDSIKITDDESIYFITYDRSANVDEYDFVLLSKSKIIQDQISFDGVELEWLKHPLDIDHTVDSIINSWRNKFYFKEEYLPEEIKGLRTPQVGAIYAALSQLKAPNEVSTIVLPTGTGKTETMLAILCAGMCNKVLVTVPSDALREQLADKFVSLGLLKEFGILHKDCINPKVGILRQKFRDAESLKSFFANCNVIISTMNITAGSTDEHQIVMASLCSHLFIDEAHHVKAQSWDKFRKRFKNEKVFQFTATPYRNDGERLEGKIIFNYPLSKAQEEGYFKRIKFFPIRQWDKAVADEKIAELAVSKLREDIAAGYEHILMARCSTKDRADLVYTYYEKHADLNPVKIYSDIQDKKNILENIRSRNSKIIVCVDMLGEGFDLPQLKIAAFHDIRKSLPITLQLAGRFTRTKHDQKLGEAKFIANIAEPKVQDSLDELYAQDANWNYILSSISGNSINNQIEFKDFIDGFKGLKDSKISFQNIRSSLSAVVYKNTSNSWDTSNLAAGIPGYDSFDYKFSDINREAKTIIIVTAQKSELEWGNFRDIYNVIWDVIIVFWETKNNLLFIHGSDKGTLYKELANAILPGANELICRQTVFKAFHGLDRIKLQNVGLKEVLGKHRRFTMSVGSDVPQAMSLMEITKAQKAFVAGTAFKDGNKVTLGCSYKGRIWSHMKGDIKQFINWCSLVGDKLVDPDIDENQVLKEALIPSIIYIRPKIYPVWIDWDEDIYNETESRFQFVMGGFTTDLSSLDLRIINPDFDSDIQFAIFSDDNLIEFTIRLFENEKNERRYPDFEIIQNSKEDVRVKFGRKNISAVDFFTEYVPTIWFADGSSLTGNEYTQLKQVIRPYNKDRILTMPWTGVNLSHESQHVDPIITDSIQYYFIEELNKQDFDVIYDDDYSGEIADIVAIKILDDVIKVNFYHLKFATGGVVSNEIKNLYEVCGQAQKSIHWKHKSGSDFFNHLLKRETKMRSGSSRSRIEKGSVELLEQLHDYAKKKISVDYEIYIVQPGFSKEKASEAILTLLGVTENFIKEFAAIDFHVIASK